MLTTLTIGVLASIASEVVTWLNAKLSGTVLKGKAAFLLAMVLALVGASIQVISQGVSLMDYAHLATTFAQIWTVAQVFFVLVVENLNLDVQSTPAVLG